MYTSLIKNNSVTKTWGTIMSIFVGIALLWLIAPVVIQFFAPEAGLVDAGIWQLIILAFSCWVALLVSSHYLAQHLYQKFILLLAKDIHSPLNTLTLWQRYVLYWALFALLALSATGCLIAIC